MFYSQHAEVLEALRSSSPTNIKTTSSATTESIIGLNVSQHLTGSRDSSTVHHDTSSKSSLLLTSTGDKSVTQIPQLKQGMLMYIYVYTRYIKILN